MAPKSEKEKSFDLDEFVSEISNGIREATTLEIQTVVCDLDVSFDDSNKKMILKPKTDSESKVDGIASRIKLVQGDIDCIMSPAFADGNMKSLREFHQLKESQAQDIVSKNIQLVKNMVNVLRSKFEEVSSSNS